MEHLSLYRKYRPKTFEEVVGQEHITRALQNQIATGKVGHAYLFTGSRGIGKTSVARIFAKAVNCLNNENGSPCGKCEVCKRLEGANDINVNNIIGHRKENIIKLKDIYDVDVVIEKSEKIKPGKFELEILESYE